MAETELPEISRRSCLWVTIAQEGAPIRMGPGHSSPSRKGLLSRMSGPVLIINHSDGEGRKAFLTCYGMLEVMRRVSISQSSPDS